MLPSFEAAVAQALGLLVIGSAGYVPRRRLRAPCVWQTRIPMRVPFDCVTVGSALDRGNAARDEIFRRYGSALDGGPS
eukprot:6211068-Pyramimonas_sp.AAC.1